MTASGAARREERSQAVAAAIADIRAIERPYKAAIHRIALSEKNSE